MRILTIDDQAFDLAKIPDDLEDDIRFSVLDNSDPNNPDFTYPPLIFLESFNSPAIVLSIGGIELAMPMEWSILIGDSECGCEAELLPLTSLNARGFEAFIYNPLSSFSHGFSRIEIVNVYNDVRWYFPRLKQNHLLTTPLSFEEHPPCAFFIKDVTRNSEVVDYFKLV